METVTVEQIIRDAEQLELDPNDSYIFSYPHLTGYLANLDAIEPAHFVIAAHFVYGWMPRVLMIQPRDVPAAAALLHDVKHGAWLDRDQLALMKSVLGNSLVAASKLLHFANTEGYAIWDSHVYRYINKRDNTYQRSKVENYVRYVENCQEIVQDPRFKPVHAAINARLGYAVSGLRAVELVMFMNGRQMR
jgi:hypothetical protein